MVNMKSIVGLLLCFIIISEAQLKFSQEMSPGFVFSWEYDDSHITIQITGPTLGWVGIGFSKTETMADAYLIIAGMQRDRIYAWDDFSHTSGVVKIDVEQNLFILSVMEHYGDTTVTVKKPLASIGKDKVIRGGVSNVIWAYGRADKFREARPSDYHGNERGYQKIILINESSNPPEVQGPFCKNIDSIPNGDVIATTQPPFKVGSSLAFKCDSGYKVHGKPFISCMSNGQWSGPASYCQTITCQRTTDKFKSGRKCKESCAKESDCKGQYNKCRCDDWCGMSCFNPEADCVALKDPENGYIIGDKRSYGLTVTYGCNDGFLLVGESTRQCQSDQNWSGSEPKCFGKN